MSQTIRQRIIAELRQREMDLYQIAQLLGMTEKEALSHLPHVQKSVTAQGGRLLVRPARCDGCGYEFTSRQRLSPPGRCPKCKQSRISGPWYTVKLRGQPER